MLSCVVPCRVVLCCVVSCRVVVLCCVVLLCRVVLCRVVLCCVALRCVVSCCVPHAILTKTVSPHAVNVIVRCCSTPRLIDVFVSALKVLCSMINERKHTACAFACSAFRFHAARVQTCRRKTMI